MAEISASMVRELREKTDAPVMECKKALSEAGGDMVQAEAILRIKLGNKASRAATRVTAEGLVAAHISGDGKLGALVEVNCETDFVAKNVEFIAFAAGLARAAATRAPADLAALSFLRWADVSVDEARKALIGKIGENVTVRRFARCEAKGRLVSYIHGGAKIGVMVDVVGGDEALGKDLAMHIAASKPLAVSKDGVPAAIIQNERSIALGKAAGSGKPADIVERMVEGAVQKFLKETTLLGQPFVKNDKQTVEQLLKSRGASVAGFVFYVVGEGIERQKEDFAAEVMAQVDQAKHQDAQRAPQPS